MLREGFEKMDHNLGIYGDAVGLLDEIDELHRKVEQLKHAFKAYFIFRDGQSVAKLPDEESTNKHVYSLLSSREKELWDLCQDCDQVSGDVREDIVDVVGVEFA